jgi:predicted Rossmann fold nucleotide-binding protein DprA/Smf involved in DNA uptake
VDLAPLATVSSADAHLGETERAVLSALPVRRASDIDTLARATTLLAPQVMSALGGLELAGLARRDGDLWRKTPSPNGA